MAATNGNGHERAAAIARAWELATVHGWSSRQIARELEISQPTALDYVRLGKEAEGHIHLYDRAKRREMSAVALDYWRAEVVSHYQKGALVLEKALPLYLAVDKQHAERLGLNAPTRIQVEHGDGEPTPSAEVLAAVAETQRVAWEEQRAIEARYGRPDGHDGDDPRG